MRDRVDARELESFGVAPDRARAIAETANRILADPPAGPARADLAERLWRGFQSEILGQRTLYPVHWLLYETALERRAGPEPLAAWWPSEEQARRTNLHALLARLPVDDYTGLHRWSVRNRSEFWELVLKRLDIRFGTPPSAIMKREDPEDPGWLPDARMNIVDSCFRAPRDRVALTYGQEGDTTLRHWTYGELESLVNRVANGLDALRLGPDDPVALYLPMTPEAVAAYLGVIRTGRPVVGIADASAPQDVENKCRIAGAKLLVTVASFRRAGKKIHLYENLKNVPFPRAVVLDGDPATDGPLRPFDLRWGEFLSQRDTYESRLREPSAVTNILFSSGTTKDPKAIPWTHTTPIKAAMDAHFHHDVHPDDVLAWPTSYGWMMGPWLTYAALLNKASFAIYNGDPRQREFGRFVRDAGVTMLGVVPKIVQDWRENARMEGLDWSLVRRFSSTAEPSEPRDMLYLMHLADYAPVIEYCGGTEIGGGYVTGTMVQPCAPSTFTTPSLGLDFRLLDAEGRPADRGEVALLPPSIGLSTTLLNYDHHEEYYAEFPKGPEGEVLRRHGDQLERLPGGYYRHLGRTKDTINLGGVKTSSEEIRHAIVHPLVADTKPVGVAVEGEQQRLVVYAVLRYKSQASPELRDTLRAEFEQAIKRRLNPLLAHVHDVVFVDDLPQAGPGKTKTSDWFRLDYARRSEKTARH